MNGTGNVKDISADPVPQGTGSQIGTDLTQADSPSVHGCLYCGTPTDDLRMGCCFDCATAGDIRLAKKSTLQHWAHGIDSLFRGVWWRARMDFKCGWERIWRTGEYAPGREWENY